MLVSSGLGQPAGVAEVSVHRHVAEERIPSTQIEGPSHDGGLATGVDDKVGFLDVWTGHRRG